MCLFLENTHYWKPFLYTWTLGHSLFLAITQILGLVCPILGLPKGNTLSLLHCLSLVLKSSLPFEAFVSPCTYKNLEYLLGGLYTGTPPINENP